MLDVTGKAAHRCTKPFNYCQNHKIYLSKLQDIFVIITKYTCPNHIFYLSIFKEFKMQLAKMLTGVQNINWPQMQTLIQIGSQASCQVETLPQNLVTKSNVI